MPKRVVRRYLSFAERNYQTILFALTVALIVALVFAISGYTKARNVENTLQAERLGKNIADVATCFNRANARPQLVVVLRAIANSVENRSDRLDVHDFVDRYEEDTPTREECADSAIQMGIDPAPYLENPPSEAGKQEDR